MEDVAIFICQAIHRSIIRWGHRANSELVRWKDSIGNNITLHGKNRDGELISKQDSFLDDPRNEDIRGSIENGTLKLWTNEVWKGQARIRIKVSEPT